MPHLKSHYQAAFGRGLWAVLMVGYISGPFVGGLWKVVHDKIEDEVRGLKKGNSPHA